MIFSNLFVRSFRTARLRYAHSRNSSSQSSMFAKDLGVFHMLALQDKAIADSFLQSNIEMKEEAMKSALKEKVDLIEAKNEIISSKNFLIELLNAQNVRKDLELCQTRGLMNMRGVFELFLKVCIAEYPTARSAAPLKTVSQQIDYVMNVKIEEKSIAKHTKVLRDQTDKFGCNLHEFYATLSRSIHGLPWYDHSIRLFINHLSEPHQILAERIVASLDLKVVKEKSDSV